MAKMQVFLTIILSIALSACGSDSSNSSDSSDRGELTLGLTDGPVENASEVVITFSSIELKGEESKVIELDSPMSVNLLDFQGASRTLLLDGIELAAGDYQWIRLGVDEAASYIEIDGQQHTFDIPSNAQTGLKLNKGFTIGAGSTTDFTIDFDLRKSVHQQGTGDYKLRPTLRIVDNLAVNTIRGTVAESLITNEECNNGDNDDVGNAVYLFSGSEATVQDLQGNGSDPMASASVSYNFETETYEFEIGFVPVGAYTVAFTCDSSLDMNDEDNSDDVSFSSSFPVDVVLDEDIAVAITAST